MPNIELLLNRIPIIFLEASYFHLVSFYSLRKKILLFYFNKTT